MKINTDGVLLGALAEVKKSKTICDIGTGTGVISLMLAQRNHEASIDAIDVDFNAVDTASINFSDSLFRERLHCHHHSMEDFFELHPDRTYDLIISNPPFFLNALKSPSQTKNLAKHTNESFFADMLNIASNHLNDDGHLQVVVPMEISRLLQNLASDYHLYHQECIAIKSFEDKNPIRHILKFGKTKVDQIDFHDFVIYKQQGEHSLQYIAALKDFFTIF